VLRVETANNNRQTFEAVARFDSGQNRFVPIPINLGPSTDLIFVILYGVGFRHAQNTDGNPDNGSAENVMVTLGGVNVPVLYAGAAPGFVGLDQCNIGAVPRSLIGRGVVDLVVKVEGKNANTIQLSIQ
jgi:uncharacterized protein (TIGR03437 family)